MMDWNRLPSVVLVKIYSVLPLQDRLRASSVCKAWREPVFQLPLSSELALSIENYQSDQDKVRFLTEHFAHKINHIKITFNPLGAVNLELVENIFKQLEINRNLRILKIRWVEECLHEVFASSSADSLNIRNLFLSKVIEPLNKVLTSRNAIETFSFPLINELAHFEDVLYSSLQKRSKLSSLRSLHLASLRISSPGGPTIQIPRSFLRAFVNLKMLTLDHEKLDDQILGIIGTESDSGGLSVFSLVAVTENKKVTNAGWTNFVQNKALYCKEIRMATLNSLISWNENSLVELELEHENYDWMDYIHPNVGEDDFLDPIIFAAWRCKGLKSLKIGYLYCGQSLVGIARLAGPALSNLEISRSKIIYHNIKQLQQEVGKALGRPWKPNEDSDRKKQINGTSKKLVSTLRAVISNEN